MRNPQSQRFLFQPYMPPILPFPGTFIFRTGEKDILFYLPGPFLASHRMSTCAPTSSNEAFSRSACERGTFSINTEGTDSTKRRI